MITDQEIIDMYNSYQSATLPHRKKAELGKYSELVSSFNKWLRNQHASEHYLNTFFSKTFSYLLKENKQKSISPKNLFSKSMRQRYANQIIHLNFKSHELVGLEEKGFEYSLTESDLEDTNKTEELQKERFYNSTTGLLWCSENTTMYHPKSKLCVECEMQADCKEIQASQYPTIYKQRV